MNYTISSENEINRELICEIIELKEQILFLKKTRIQKKTAEKSLNEFEERLKFALEGAQEGLFDWNIETGEVYYSLNWGSGNNTPDIFVGKKEICRQDVSNFLNFIRAYLKDDRSSYKEEYKVKLRKKGYHWININFKVVKRDKNGQPLRILGNLINISEQKISKELFFQSEKEKTIILDNISDILIYYDKLLNIQWANKAAGKNFSFDPDKIAGCSYKKIENAKYHLNIKIIFNEVLKTGRYQETEVEDSLGKHWFVRISPIFDSNNQVISIMEFGQDITERKRLEEEQIKACKYESIKILASGIAHDFNNLLTIILGNISLANMNVDKNELQRIMSSTEKAIHRTKKLSNQLLAFSRGEESTTKIISIEKIIRKSSEMCLRGSIIRKRIIIDENILQIEADEDQMFQMFDNLFINSLQAMPQGGNIEVSAGNYDVGPFDSLPIEKGKYLKISFKDNGFGISKENIHRIFEPYYTSKQKGNGIGLSSVYLIVQRHGGYIEAESEPNAGTIFNIYLPAFTNKALNKSLHKSPNRLCV